MEEVNASYTSSNETELIRNDHRRISKYFMWPFPLGGRIKRCTPSVSQSVCLSGWLVSDGGVFDLLEIGSS